MGLHTSNVFVLQKEEVFCKYLTHCTRVTSGRGRGRCGSREWAIGRRVNYPSREREGGPDRKEGGSRSYISGRASLLMAQGLGLGVEPLVTIDIDQPVGVGHLTSVGYPEASSIPTYVS